MSEFGSEKNWVFNWDIIQMISSAKKSKHKKWIQFSYILIYCPHWDARVQTVPFKNVHFSLLNPWNILRTSALQSFLAPNSIGVKIWVSKVIFEGLQNIFHVRPTNVTLPLLARILFFGDWKCTTDGLWSIRLANWLQSDSRLREYFFRN